MQIMRWQQLNWFLSRSKSFDLEEKKGAWVDVTTENRAGLGRCDGTI